LVTGSRWPAISGAGAPRLADSGARVVVTGGGGWLGLATLEMLHGLLGDAFHDRVACFGSRARRLRLRGGLEVDQAPLAALGDLPTAPTLVLHLGFVTQGPQMTLGPEAYVAANREISRKVVSALDAIGAQAVFLASSGAAYQADASGGAQSKQLYGWLKLEDERAFRRWGEASGATLVTARIFNLAGPYINRRSTYALASFIEDVLAERPIKVQATNPVYRSYTAIEELMSVGLGVMTGPGGRSVSFDTAGDVVVEMGDLADAVASALRSKLGVARPPLLAGAAPDRYVGHGERYAELGRELGVHSVSLGDQIRRTADYLASHREPQ
jgi:nucleoside-diphosphate-sugar epimerase